MTTQKFAIATIAGGVTLFVLGGLLYGVVLIDFFMSNVGTAQGAMKETRTGCISRSASSHSPPC